MSFEKNVSVKSGNRLSLSGSSIETTGSLYGSVLSGTVGQFTSLSSSLVRINNAYTLPTSDGTTGQVISTNGSGQLTFTSVSAGSSPGGPDTSVQFNKSSTLSGSSDLTYNYTTGVLSGTLSSFTQISASYIDLGYPSEILVHEQGRLYYDDSNNRLKVQTEISSSAEGITEITLGQQLAVRVKNISGVSLAKGKIVHISGSTNSDTPLVTTASYESDSVSADTLGVLMSTVAANDTGYALLYGVLTGIDLSAYAVGDMLYLSSSGDFTTTVPQSPLHEVRIGQITRAGPSANGAMFVRIQNGYETDELHDVLFSSKAEGDLISWDATTGVWRNKKQLTGSYEITGDITASNGQFTNITADKITAREYHTELVSASIIYQSGSTKFGDTNDDVHQFTGSVSVNGATTLLSVIGTTAQFTSITASVNGNITGNAFTATKLQTARNLTTIGDVLVTINSFDGSSNVSGIATIDSGRIVNSHIKATANISDTKLATISTPGKVSNSATTATNTNTINAIVARDASGNFSAGTITANLDGNASTVTDGVYTTGNQIIGGVKTFTSTITGSISGSDAKFTSVTGSFQGNLAGNATSATNVAATETITNSAYYIPFMDGYTTANRAIRSDSGITYNPSSNTLTVGTLVETSTREIKENIKTIPNQLNNLKKLNPVKYNKINSEREEIGLIAEEVQEVYPEFVHNKGINYPKMVSVLISAIQELTTKVEKQQKEITSLKKKIKS